jgi:hypothetical protein
LAPPAVSRPAASRDPARAVGRFPPGRGGPRRVPVLAPVPVPLVPAVPGSLAVVPGGGGPPGSVSDLSPGRTERGRRRPRGGTSRSRLGRRGSR